MNSSELKIGDRIRITAVPGEGMDGYYIHPDTVEVFKQLLARGRSVRIARKDGYGQPWYDCRFRTQDGMWEHHSLAVIEGETNWKLVKAR